MTLPGWHPIAADRALGERPIAARLAGEPVALWRDAAGVPHAVTDRCPHRGTRLSLGTVRVVEGESRIECPYHGWQFGSDGRCRHVPAQPGFLPTESHRVLRHRLRCAHGVLWIKLAGAPEDDGAFPLPDPIDLLPRRIVCGPYDVATSAPRIVENFLDVSHFAFVHEGLLGDRAEAVVPHYELVADVRGAPGIERYRAWQPQASLAAPPGSWVDYRYQVLTPYSAMLHKTGPSADSRAITTDDQMAPSVSGTTATPVTDAIALWVCPTSSEASRVWMTLFTADMQSDEATLREFQDRIFLQDLPILESQQPKALPLSGGEVHGAADRLSAAYRRYLQREGVALGVC